MAILPRGSPSPEDHANSMSPFRILFTSLGQVPGLRILFGVVAVLAIVAVAREWALDHMSTIIGGVAIVGLAAVLLVIAWLSKAPSGEFRGPARWLMWGTV